MFGVFDGIRQSGSSRGDGSAGRGASWRNYKASGESRSLGHSVENRVLEENMREIVPYHGESSKSLEGRTEKKVQSRLKSYRAWTWFLWPPGGIICYGGSDRRISDFGYVWEMSMRFNFGMKNEVAILEHLGLWRSLGNALHCDQQDLGYLGDLFTWCNQIEYLETAFSDHPTILLINEVEEEFEAKCPKPRFRFEAAWVRVEDWAEVMANGWVSSHREELERGILQGYPLSPYLFLLCAETFSNLIQQEERIGNIQGVATYRGGPRVSHLLFANDTLIFCQAMWEAELRIKTILNILEEASDLKMNMSKSAIVFSRNTPTK
ncbi:hypothetical protein Sango_1732400 [Sesamum angolense]|uniref:Reverse transcriptase domain-containing protein n=1 Tax=Sesamum angolense TaxID=2727404 RepID=A0AAE2BS51_9LAMI|nr:hypothetical protein Sango_1732400 [Sesamum angolense]